MTPSVSSAIAPTIPNVLLDPSSTPAGRIATKLAADLIGAAARELASRGARALANAASGDGAPSPAKAARARASGAGYASAASTAKATTAKKTSTTKKTTTSKTSSSKHPAGYAFLDDPKLSIEDKLMMLLAKLNKQYEAEMQKYLDAMAPAKSSSSSSGSGASSTKSGGILGGFAKAVSNIVKNVPGAGAVADVLGNKTVQSILKTVGGPVLGAAASVLGFPEAAPVLMKLAPEIADVAGKVANEVSGSRSSDTGTLGTSSGGGTTGTPPSNGDNQLEFLQLQRVQEKQRDMFQLASNIFKAMHDTRSAIIGNLR